MGSTGRIAPVLTGGDELYFDSITDRGGGCMVYRPGNPDFFLCIIGNTITWSIG
jgi:hypothetical protein